MASTYSTSLKIQLMGNGEDSGTWGSITNTNWNLIEQAVSGVQTITMANSNYTLTNLNGVSDEARNMVLVVQGTNSGIYQVIAPLNQPKMYVISNQTTGGYAITIGASSGSIVTIPNGVTAQVYTDGTNFYSAQTGSAGNFNVNGTLTASGVTDTGSLTVGSTLAVTGTSTFTGAVALNGGGTSTTPTAGDNSTKIATTAFVAAATGTLGTMSTQNANNVAITGGTINGVTGTNSGMTVGTATNATNVSGTVAAANGGTGITSSGTNGNVLRSNGSGWASAAPVNIGTAQASTSGSTITFGSIPAYTKRITVMFNSLGSTAVPCFEVRLGTSGGIQSSGYLASAAAGISTSNVATSTSGFPVRGGGGTLSGVMTITLLDPSSNIWVAAFSNGTDTNQWGYGGGTVTMTGTVTQVQMFTGGTFNNGSFNILYE
jgi:hypothetical protein